MISTSKVLRLAFVFAALWAMGTWILVSFPFSQQVILDNSVHYPQAQRQSQQQQQQQLQPNIQSKVTIDDDTTFSACLLVMDDNHFLIEWIAYHYHVLPLRYLIVAMDPRSQTSPSPILDRWRDKMTIVEWKTDDDYSTLSERNQAEDTVRRHFGNLTTNLIRHRARQRIFYYKCLKKLKHDGKSWSILTDTDEFLRINEPKVRELDLVPTMSVEEPASIRGILKAELQRPGTNLTKSPCIQIPRLRFGAIDGKDDKRDSLPLGVGFNKTQFLTLRWRNHAGVEQYWFNKISKVILDMSQVPWEDLVPVESIHRPIKSMCSQWKLHINISDSILVINHYLGSWEQYEYRKDARIATVAEENRNKGSSAAIPGGGRGRQQYDKHKMVNATTSNEILPWLKGFVKATGRAPAETLLKGVGQLEPKTFLLSSSSMSPTNVARKYDFMPQYANNERCAILFFGLPRSFQDLVLPSIQKNLIVPNARYNCDYFVHYFNRTEEPEGRLNKGGKINPDEIFLLREAAQTISASTATKVHNDRPTVEFHGESEDEFWTARNEAVQRYRNTKGDDGHYLYFPWRAKSYEYPTSLDNIVKQWHSINGAWELMAKSAATRGIQYTRIGMFRSDALYVTPIDLYQTNADSFDNRNNQAVLAPFGAMPVNDRMFYGPYEAVDIWATRRFSFLENYVHTCEKGWAMHSEKFLDGAILPAIRELGISIVVNPDVCFLRTRVNFSVVETDCQLMGSTRGFEDRDMKNELENILERKCGEPFKLKIHHRGIQCLPL